MIYVLFGPPGVGKTYIGDLMSRRLNLQFLDADLLISNKEIECIREGKYTQKMRDDFCEKLEKHVEKLLSQSNKDIIVAEAFTKEKNRKRFHDYFKGNVLFIRVSVPKGIAEKRMKTRKKIANHVIDETSFKTFWEEFDEPKLVYRELYNKDEDDLMLEDKFKKIASLS